MGRGIDDLVADYPSVGVEERGVDKRSAPCRRRRDNAREVASDFVLRGNAVRRVRGSCNVSLSFEDFEDLFVRLLDFHPADGRA